jgi:hypothetical protein
MCFTHIYSLNDFFFHDPLLKCACQLSNLNKLKLMQLKNKILRKLSIYTITKNKRQTYYTLLLFLLLSYQSLQFSFEYKSYFNILYIVSQMLLDEI